LISVIAFQVIFYIFLSVFLLIRSFSAALYLLRVINLTYMAWIAIQLIKCFVNIVIRILDMLADQHLRAACSLRPTVLII